MASADWRGLLSGATPALSDLLDPARGALQPPLRSELFGLQRFAQHGRSLGETHRAAPASPFAPAFFPQLAHNIRTLRLAHGYIGAHAATGYDISPAAEWLLDNFHLVEAQLKAIHEGLPRSYFRALPVLLDEPLAGLPRVYGVAWAFVAHTDGAFDETLLAHFLNAYQETRALSLSEIWALPTTLRVVLIESLRRLAERVAANKAAREAANRCCDAIERASGPVPLTELDALLARLTQRGVDRAFLAQMTLRLQDLDGQGAAPRPSPALAWLQQHLSDPAALQAQQRADQTADNLSVSNAMRSLRAIGDADWSSLVARTSALMQRMLGSPVFAAEDSATRDRSLHAIEALARRSQHSEVEVADTLLGLMRAACPQAAPTAGTLPVIEPMPSAAEGQLAATPTERTEARDDAAPDERSGEPQPLPADASPTVPHELPHDTPHDLPDDLPAAALAEHWLHGGGRALLAAQLGLSEPWRVLRTAAARRLVLPLYLGAIALGSVLGVGWLLRHHGGLLAGPMRAADWLQPGLIASVLLMAVPASEAVIAVIHRLISESVRPTHLPRLALAQGLTARHRVLVAMPAMLTSRLATQALVHRLRQHHLANPEPHSQFALLTDWADADAAQAPNDDALLDDAATQVEALNRMHPRANGPPRFVLLHRPRRFSPTEQRWIGWERKRGKLELLVAALAEGHGEAFIDLGKTSTLATGTRYIITLDSDTQLPPGRLRELVGVAAHPHNQPRLDASGRSVISGYGILQPRIATPLPAPREITPYHALFAGQCGIDPYSATSSEVYQDLFGEGSFSGKGLLNVAAMHGVLSGRLPEGQVLSHDLIEGSMARCAAVTDISLIEDAPFHADVAASRVHRWTRGDWQLLPFLLAPRQHPLRAVNRWKMSDNLRRSLVAPASLALLLLSWLTPPGAPGLTPLAALALVLSAYLAGPLLGALASLAPRAADVDQRHYYRMATRDLGRVLQAGLWQLAMLLQHAVAALDAIGRALYRMTVSHRQLLQWTTAATAQAQAHTSLRALLRRHGREPVLALALLGGLWALARWRGDALWQPSGRATGQPFGSTLEQPFGWGAEWIAVPLCVLWAAAPLWTWWVSRPRRVRLDAELPVADQVYLHGIARDSWRLFERCVGADDHHLPPDNLQTDPYDLVAHRTSPTNIGLYLLSVACAREFGWIDSAELVRRLDATLGTLDQLQRHRGHFLNWYDTRTAQPLLPMYVSTVDSGNLAGHLLAVAQACLERAHGEGGSPADRDAGTDAAPESALAADLRRLAARCEALAWEADFAFLYHRKRRLLHIGYRVAEQQLDAGFYDLLASESRLTSLLAIAKGDVPVAHWAALGRPIYAAGAHTSLRSWSGSMFEYLMPTLVLAEPHGSVLRDGCHGALAEQIAHGHAHHVPWGVSESAYAERDHTLAYQYAPQGVARLALRRTPPDELVIAPYATALAALLEPALACHNFRALEALSARGSCGFIEAIDFTPGRQTGPSRCTRVSTFMAHHQGMSLVALCNTLHDGAAQRWGMANPHLEAVATLMHEHAPREVSRLSAPPAAASPAGLLRRAPALLREVRPGHSALEPTQVLGNGRYAVTLRANGAGTSRWGTLGITRWRDDALRDEHGSFFYLRGLPQASQPQRLLDRLFVDHPFSDRPVSDRSVTDRSINERRAEASGPPGAVQRRSTALASLTQHPAPDPAASYRAVFHADRVSFEADWPSVQAHTSVWVSPEDDIEFRQVELRNLGNETLEIELISAFDVTLADPRADEAHPAFGNLFVSAHWLPAQQALLFERRPRLATESGVQMAHFLTHGDPQITSLSVQTDRQRWLGRNHATNRPLASFDAAPAGAGDASAQSAAHATTPGHASEAGASAADEAHVLDTGLDPVCALAVGLRIAPQGKVRLTFATAASDHTETLRAVIDKYRQSGHVQRASLMSATLSTIRLRGLGISAENFAAVQSLTSALLLTLTRPRVALTRGSSATRTTHLRRGEDGLSHLVRPDVGPRPVCDRRLLWRHGLSGERAIILVHAGVPQGLGLVRSLAQALRLWAWGGVGCDLVIVNAEPTSYLMGLQPELLALRERHAADSAALGGAPVTALTVLRADELSADELATLNALARLRLSADGRPLQHQVQDWLLLHEQARDARETGHVTEVAAAANSRGSAQIVPAPTGTFEPDRGDFQFEVSALLRPTRPWINVLSNPGFGGQLSEAGGGNSWALNSRLNQLTAWSNDPVSDAPSEHVWLQDLRSGQVWSVAPSAWGDDRISYQVSHGQGSSQIRHRRGDLEVTATWCVDATLAVKQVRVELLNHGTRHLSLRLVGLAEWILGAQRADRASTHTLALRQTLPQPAAPAEGRSGARQLLALLCSQREQAAGFGDGTAFLALADDVQPEAVSDAQADAMADSGFGALFGAEARSTPGAPTSAGSATFGIDRPASALEATPHPARSDPGDWTCDRRECVDARGRLVLPDHFGQQAGAGLDPCAALSTRLTLAPGERAERSFLLGHAANVDEAAALALQAAAQSPRGREAAARAQWDALLGATQVSTPDPLFDVLVNRWLIYQTVTCRLWSKAGFYQAGGATGYRDQLQDAVALAWAAPERLREQILLCASRQFEPGDVQHWWHAPGGAGVRTHFSDDLLWLPWACAIYLQRSGDTGVLDAQVPFLAGAEIPPGAEDVYDTPRASDAQASVWEHAARSIDHSLTRGVHGLPLMGSGDWNDGMNRVGHEGRGESVWLAWFLCRVVADCAPLARLRGEAERASRWEHAAADWATALEGVAWDGAWYTRAYFDDGTPLGSHANAEAQIDLIAQAWSVLSGLAPIDHQREAMASMNAHLGDREHGLMRLLDPPLQHAEPSAGYIQAYPPGVRENGGQYAHAAVWALMAQAELARYDGTPADDAWRTFTWLSPAHRAAHPVHGPAYRIEPYVMAGDICSQPPHAGRGGWSWYTGSAGWMHRAAVESILGLNLKAGGLSLHPALPSHWPQAEITLRRGDLQLNFLLLRATHDAARASAATRGAQLLVPGEAVRWRHLSGAHAYVVVVPPLSGDTPAT